ncbi:class I SAM-dependent methyltransferase [Methanococcus aeolicus]|uniref:Methyltransferase type 11 n=1 Tax=Methanococcus aeolicus (strain ATCC BAA-1280 / DSM 17508 / OCM 812 / Nankai-3) TaxID=419665 RepID=A6UUB2_META3|nr:class I SAM-dependent methyltransferase [Methanococcus aeolicus]ABR56084.1 Methyltransferase type 11 [Methanococcus aeolicus Nankai-3]UXM85313.1 class I SAM-dependent methyltransferase [Methanococcus aeolicus]
MDKEKQTVKKFYDNWKIENFPKYINLLMEFEEDLLINIINNSDNFKKIKNNLILDCGCGHGSYYNLTKEYNAIYFDFSTNLLKKFEKKHNLKTNKICGDISNLPFKDNSFDLILCINVLEHIKDYKKALMEIKRVLKPNAMAIIVVVNKESCINEDIFNDFVVYHRPLKKSDFNNLMGFDLIKCISFYFIPPLFKIFPAFILKRILSIFHKVDIKLNEIFKNKGQFLYIELKKQE